MLRDFLLASLHHLLAFGLVTLLAAQSMLLSRPIDTAAIRRLSGLDIGYGVTAGSLLAVGLARSFLGLKGAGFYLHDPWFHAKLGAFLLVALVSIAPTVAFLRWRRATRNDPHWLPEPRQAARLRGLVRIELLLVAAIVVCAAAVPRHGGLWP